METQTVGPSMFPGFRVSGRLWESEFDCQATDEALRRADDEELVVDGSVGERFVEQVADADQHLPLRGAEVHERQGLRDAHVEARAEPGRINAITRVAEYGTSASSDVVTS